MNIFAKILMGVGAVALLASCNQKAEYRATSYVSFASSQFSVAENAGSIELPVNAYTLNSKGVAFPSGGPATTEVSFEVVDGTAARGVNFTVEPSDGILSFDGESQASIKINVIDMPGVSTGDLYFTIKFTGATNGYTLAGGHETTVVISDLDHPLAAILGTWTADVVDDWGDAYTVATTIEATSETTVTMSGLLPYLKSNGYDYPCEATVSDDLTTITIPALQIYANVCYFIGLDLSSQEIVDVVFHFDEAAGTLTLDESIAVGGYTGEEFYDLYYGNVVFTKR